MTNNNQQLKLEVEKLKNQVKAADEGEGFFNSEILIELQLLQSISSSLPERNTEA